MRKSLKKLILLFVIVMVSINSFGQKGFNIKNMTNFPLKDWNILLEKVDILLSSSPLVGGEIEKENREKVSSQELDSTFSTLQNIFQ